MTIQARRNLLLGAGGAIGMLPGVALAQAIGAGGGSGGGGVSGAASGMFNVKTYGAIGDGSSHTAASMGYATLSALQAAFSFATATTNQMDWLGTQAAINAAASHLNGGRVYAPAGTYVFDKPAVFPITTTDFYFPIGPVVDMVGDGMGVTIFGPVADFGAKSAVISCGLPGADWSDATNAGSGRYATGGFSFGLFSDFTVRNGLGISTNKGVAVNISGTAIAMDGICWGARREMRRVTCEGFRAGINIVGDHTVFDSCYFQNNTYGVYMASASKYLYGDLAMRNSFVNGNMIAGFFISKNAFLNMNCTGELYMGGQPYSFLGESGTPDSYGQPFGGGPMVPMFSNMKIDVLQSETIGNGLIWDDNMTNTGGTVNAGVREIDGLTIETLYVTYGAGSHYTTGGRNLFAWIGAGVINGLDIKRLYSGSMLYQSGVGMVNAVTCSAFGFSSGGLVMSGDLDNWLASYTAASIETINGGAFNTNGIYVRLVCPGKWEGGVVGTTTGSTSAWTAGQPIEMNNTSFQCVLAGGTNPVFGINMQAWTSGPAGKYTVYADKGIVQVKVSGTSTANALIKAAASGGATAATSGTDGSIIGINLAGGTTPITRLRL